MRRPTTPTRPSLLALLCVTVSCSEADTDPPTESVIWFRTVAWGRAPVFSRPVDETDRSRERVRVRRIGDEVVEVALEQPNGVEAWVVIPESGAEGTVTRRTLDAYGVLDTIRTIDAADIVRTTGRSGKTTVDGCAAYQWTPDDLGRVARQGCLDRQGRAVVDLWGCHEYRAEWSPNHDLASRACFDPNGRAVFDADGVHRTTYRRDSFGAEVERSFFDTEGSPVRRASDGCAGLQTVRDEQGQIVGETCLNQGNLPTAHKNSSHAGWSGKRNANGCVVERTFTAVGGGPASRGEVHHEVFVMDRHCKVLDRRHLDREELLVQPSPHTPARTLRQWNDEGLLVRRECFGADGAAASCKFMRAASEGGSVHTYDYDDLGRLTTERAWSAAGAPAPKQRGEYPHATHNAYDDESRLTGQTYSDVDGKPATALGAWGFAFDYDGLDALVSTRYLNAEGGPAASVLGCAEVRNTYDHLHRL